jgi:threonine aldolase
MTVDLRSDTMTKPTSAMLDAMMKAEVGDDVFGEDPSINKLEAMAAEMFGMEAALYSPTGTMSNQIGIKVHTQPGDEVICDKTAHVYQYEGGGIAFNSGCQVKLLDGDNGRFTAAQVAAAVNADDVHKARTSLVCIENTSNRGGGSCYDLEEIKRIRKTCDDNKLMLHLDGARLFNALVAKNEKPKQYGAIFHSISVCLNKGLGCPVGSILIGGKDYIKKARRVRKVFGGGMRQAGYLAASGIYALENHINRLAEDHENARKIAAAVAKKDFAGNMLPVETNIIIFEIKPPFQAKQIAETLKKHNILTIAISPTQIRMVLHLNVTREMVNYTIDVINKYVTEN